MAGQGYIGMSVTPEAREALRWLIHEATGKAGRQVGISEALTALSALGRDHMDELVQRIKQPTK